MTTQQELTDRCTPEIIKKMCELAEGFEYIDRPFPSIKYSIMDKWADKIIDSFIFPLFIHRTVEGWNKSKTILISIFRMRVCKFSGTEDIVYYDFVNYQSTTLTQAECAMLHCMLDIFKGEGK